MCSLRQSHRLALARIKSCLVRVRDRSELAFIPQGNSVLMVMRNGRGRGGADGRAGAGAISIVDPGACDVRRPRWEFAEETCSKWPATHSLASRERGSAWARHRPTKGEPSSVMSA